MYNNEKSVPDIVREMETEDSIGNTVISKYVTYSQRENIERIGAYLNSKHISGSQDSMGRDKPFFNICISNANVWYRATDIDRKNIKLLPTKKAHYAMTFVMSILLQEWMRKSKFATFLNEWGRVLSRYGSAIVEFVEKKGELIARVLPWDIVIVDPIDFDNNWKIKKLWLTPAQLMERKEYDQDIVQDLIENRKTRQTTDGQKKDNKAEYIEIYEAHGYAPMAHLQDDKDEDDRDWDTFVHQIHVLSYVGKKKGKSKYDYEDYTLYKGKEKKCPQMVTHLIKEDGRTMSIGAVEHMFEPQWMTNHSMKAMKDQLDLASKLIYQTADGNYVGQNILTDIENGDILVWNHEAGGTGLTQINNHSHDITSLQNFAGQWKALGNEMNSISESMMGANPPSGTAWRQTQALLQESHSLFEIMRENKGNHIDDMLREYIIPYLMKKMDTTEEIAAILDEEGIEKIDLLHVPSEARKLVNEALKEDVLNKTPEQIANGELFTPEMEAEMMVKQEDALRKSFDMLGNQRFIKPSEIEGKTWKQALEGFEWDVMIDVTKEQKDIDAILATLSTVFSTIAGMKGQPMPPEMQKILNKIISLTGHLSPLKMTKESTPTAQPAAQMPAPPAPQPVTETPETL